MDDSLRELYQDVILDHSKHPRHFGTLEHATHSGKGHNPLCGDRVTVMLVVDSQDRIADIKFEGKGCAISQASASLMTEAVKGLTADAFTELHTRVHDVLTRHDAEIPTDLGKLAALGGVREYPARVKCASLSWRTLEAALAGAHAVTTE